MKPVLLRIPFSHFCKKVEWALTQCGIEYTTLDISIGKMRNMHRANPTESTVPVLFLPDQERFVFGSHAILKWAEANRAQDTPSLYPAEFGDAIDLVESWADEEVGPVSRREAYRVLYGDPWNIGFSKPVQLLARMLRKVWLMTLKHYKARRFEEADAAAVPEILGKIGEQLDDAKTGYLFTDHPTAADFAVAALANPMLYMARSRDYGAHEGWSQTKDFVRRVKPAKTTRTGGRRIRESDWVRFEKLNEKHAAAPEILA